MTTAQYKFEEFDTPPWPWCQLNPYVPSGGELLTLCAQGERCLHVSLFDHESAQVNRYWEDDNYQPPDTYYD
jgi:hypothetical protein